MTNYVHDLSEMEGQIFNRVYDNYDSSHGDRLIFENDKVKYVFYHEQDCCEGVSIEDIVGDLKDLEGTPLLVAREDSNSSYNDYESYTWTFYNFSTIKGSVTVRWYGTSNGYYSESVSCKKYDLEHK